MIGAEEKGHQERVILVACNVWGYAANKEEVKRFLDAAENRRGVFNGDKIGDVKHLVGLDGQVISMAAPTLIAGRRWGWPSCREMRR